MSETSSALHFSLRVEVRRECELPLGVHPIFRLPQAARTAQLEFSSQARAWTSPAPEDTSLVRFRGDRRNIALDALSLEARSDDLEDLTQLPLRYTAEELVLVTGAGGDATLINREGCYRVQLRWDPRVFPTCQVWISNRGRSTFPWNGLFLAVGIDPVCAAFDYGVAVSRNRKNPLWREGIACTQRLSPASPLETTYRIEVSDDLSGRLRS